MGKPAAGIGERINAARKIKGLNQSQLAKLVGVTRAAVSHWEKGRSDEIKASILVRLSDITNTNLRWLATGEGTPQRRIINGDAEVELLDIFRGLEAPAKQALIAAARAFLAADDTPSTAAHPVKHAPPPPQLDEG